MINSALFGNGYWANVVKRKIDVLTNLVFVADSKTDFNSLAWRGVDVAFVCSSTSSHYDVVRTCLDHDIKLIFCEKPFTGSYEAAMALFKSAEERGADIFVDNLFLLRRELVGLDGRNVRRFSFGWEKLDFNHKENICDSLLYHDLYILLALSGDDQWSPQGGHVGDSTLYLEMTNNDRLAVFGYDRLSASVGKWMVMDGRYVDLSSPGNDPLLESIEAALCGKADYESNRELTLKTIWLLDFVKKKFMISP